MNDLLWVFDHDGTLYDDALAHAQMRRLTAEYVSKALGISTEAGAAEMKRLKEKWGTKFSFVAWSKERGTSAEEFIRETYLRIDLPRCVLKAPDTDRRRALERLVGHKVIFSNSPMLYVERVMRHCDLFDCFTDTIGMELLDLQPKPSPRSFEAVERRHPSFRRIIFCDNDLTNLGPARARGWETILYQEDATVSVRDGHRVICSFDELVEEEST